MAVEAIQGQMSCRGEGNVRQLQAGQWFSLAGHPYYDRFNAQEEREFVVCSARFIANNNLPQGLTNRLTASGSPFDTGGSPRAATPTTNWANVSVGDAAFGVPSQQSLGDPSQQSFANRLTANVSVGDAAFGVPSQQSFGVPSSPPPYWVEIETRKRGLPLTPAYGHTAHAKPTAKGLQTATVTGPEGEEVYTDEMGRVKIQFHWQRVREHASFGANLDERSSCWVRVGTPGAGSAWGHQSLPRVGQEVLVSFIEGDIDRPVVTGVIHNGRQPNPWFSGAGSLPANRALTGIKTKEHHGQQYGELLFDDTTGQVRTKLSSEHGKTQLNQGFLTHARQDGKAKPRGDGFELRTDFQGALRAAEGLLITTEAQPGATGKQLDREQALELLQAARKNVQTLAEAAEKQNADAMETGPEERGEEGQRGQEIKWGHLEHLVEALKAWEAGTNTDPKGDSATGQSGKQPVILMSGAEGIGLTTPKELALIAEKNLDTVSLRDTQQSTVRRWIHNVGKRISLFVVGVADKFNLKLITAEGHAKLEAQAGDVEITGEQNVRIAANKQKLTAAAREELLLTCAGAYIRLKGGKIDVHCPGNISFKSAGQSFDGPTSLDEKLPGMPDGRLDELERLPIQDFSG